MFENQKQETGDSAVSLQAGRDLIINGGVSFSEVKEIFHLLLQENFPVLREIAAQAAHQNTENFLAKFEIKFMGNLDRIDMEKLKDPDVQFSLNEAVGASARRGDKMDSDLLSELIIERIGKDTPDLISIVSSEAIKTLPKLTSEHIAFLSLAYYISSVGHSEMTSLFELETVSLAVIAIAEKGFGLSKSNIKYLKFTGLVSSLGAFDHSIEITRNKAAFLNDLTNSEIEVQISAEAPSYKRLIDECRSSEMCKITLTSVGEMIAIANLKRVFYFLDYRIWIS